MASTNYHTPIVVGSLVESDGPGDGAVNPRLASLDQALTDIIAGVFETDTDSNISIAGDWNTKHIVMNGGHLWVNGGSLYYKSSAPTSGTDGTLIA